MAAKTVDVNCDLGESFGAYRIGMDAEIMPYITSANIACGYHAGDPAVMRATVRLAMRHGVGIGAHPGLQDLAGFGRRAMRIDAKEAYELTLYQLGALWAFVKSEGGAMRHVKPHGALYNMAAADEAIAEGIAEAIYRIDPELMLFGLAGSELIRAAERLGLRAANEVFADRRYEADGSLTPRHLAGAVIHDAEEACAQAVRMAGGGGVVTRQGTLLPVYADTICIHGDSPGALEYATALRSALESAGIGIAMAGSGEC
ncbi:LamB/YcsF family protein [Paenibacillus xanthanilyticus]|uniref:5-oxoprolinase subunit A n=1 Tax=Paenibacillus xanthanilyticus TaxID=1783531 RepID=A0ABV8KAQ6_9BACL